MNRLILNTGEYKINDLLSSNFPFCVYKATDKSGKNLVIKTLFDLEQTITSLLETYHCQHSYDLKTSIFYSHIEADINQIKGKELLKEQYNYLCQCCENYNLDNCFWENDFNGKPYLIYDFIEGQNLNEIIVNSKIDLFLNMIPSLLEAISKNPHGDLSFANLIIHKNGRKFSIIDPAIKYDKLFFTNTEYYPLVPPLFYSTKNGYAAYADQLAIALMLYKLLTGTNPLKKMSKKPFWTNHFGNGIGGCITDDIYSVVSMFPDSWEIPFYFDDYVDAIKSQLKLSQNKRSNFEFIRMTGSTNDIIDFPQEFFEIKPPVHLNQNISKDLSDFCMTLIYNYEPVDWYTHKINQLKAE